MLHNVELPHQSRGKDGVVRTATHNGLDNPGCDFPDPPKLALRPTQPPVELELALLPRSK
jgi:hypothetical protein